MNLHIPSLAGLKGRIRGMFNLNDPRWGRGGDDKTGGQQPADPQKPDNGRGRAPTRAPPDLDELWRDFNRKLGGLFGGKGKRPTTAAMAAVAVSSPT
jgi:membrane protease subunit HflK